MRIKNTDPMMLVKQTGKTMNIHEFEIMSVDGLKRYMNSTPEKEYILVDVRQPGEYIQAHIPGALLMPLSEFQSKISSLPDDKDIVFYCLSGSRSRTAAMLAADQKISQKNIYSLEGGISKWTGASLGNVPKIEIFDTSQSVSQLIKTAIRMEKGAELFYLNIQELSPLTSDNGIFSHLAEAEVSHAKSLFDLWLNDSEKPLQTFEEFYEHLTADVVEGGDALNDLIGYIHQIQKYGCVNLLDLAMDVEFASYDLYKTMANLKSGVGYMAAIFLTIAQAEKSHMKLIADSYERCPDGKMS
jgi:sulfur-carrier protein adenylyltransferase/sulfurtransferase